MTVKLLLLVLFAAALSDSALVGSPFRRRVSFYLAPSMEDADYYVDVLREQGGNKVATSLLMWCGLQVGPGGVFTVDATKHAVCTYMRGKLAPMQIEVEPIVASNNFTNLHDLYENSNTSIQAITSYIKETNLTGISWDTEPKYSHKDSCRYFSNFLGKLREALAPHGARVTVYSNDFSAIIKNPEMLSHGPDRVVGGETYDAKKTGVWIEKYHQLVNPKINRSRVAVAMSTSTKKGQLNCDSTHLPHRIQLMLNDSVPELTIFSLRMLNGTVDGHHVCGELWFPLARDFLAGRSPTLP